MKDTIYRDDAINCLCNGKCLDEMRWCDGDYCPPVTRIKQLPSAQPEVYLIGCLYAVNKLIEKGSFAYSVKVDGRFETVPWVEVKEWIEKQYGINQEDTNE